MIIKKIYDLALIIIEIHTNHNYHKNQCTIINVLTFLSRKFFQDENNRTA